MRVADSPAARATAPTLLARTAAEVVGIDANPDAHAHAAARYVRPTCASSGTWSRTSPGRCDAVVFLQTIEHIEDVPALLEAIAAAAPLAFISTPNRLTLAPEGAEKSDNPWHLREYTIDEYRELLEPAFASVEIHGLFHAGKLAIHERAIGLGWDRVHSLLRITKPFYDRFTPAISACGLRACGRRPRRTSSRALDFVAVCRRGERLDGRGRDVGDIAIVLHRHMPYVEGFGTYPFGEEWLFDAVVRSYLPVLAVARDLTMTVTPVLADQLEDAATAGGCGISSAITGSRSAELDARDVEPASSSRRAGPRPSATGARWPARALGGDPLGAVPRRGAPRAGSSC